MISIIIPLYNKERSIINTLRSVVNQTFTEWELIVVNDGSKDDSLHVVETYTSSLQFNIAGKIRIINKTNGGVSSARNRGINEAKYDYVALLDGDDLWEPTYLEEQFHLLQDFPDAAMWGVNYAMLQNGNSYKCEQGMGDGFRGYVRDYFATKHCDLFSSSAVVIRKSAFDIAGYFDERISYSEDLDMWYRIIYHFPVVFYDKVLSYYNLDSENRCGYGLVQHHDLKRYLPYFIDKYKKEFSENKAFSTYVNTLVATILLKEDYYFGSVQDRMDAQKVVNNLFFSDIHPKYRWIFRTPRWIGLLVYNIVCIKKKIRS